MYLLKPDGNQYNFLEKQLHFTLFTDYIIGQLPIILPFIQELIKTFYKSHLMPRIEITIVPREVGQIFDELIEDLLNDLTRQPTKNEPIPLKQLILHHYYPNYDLYQGRCYQQFSSNLCGYHATFNSLCCLNMFLNLKSSYAIQSGASFWKFKMKVQRFLFQIKKANKLQDKWPWRQKDILYGDFQRTYNKVCVQMFDDFDIFKEDHQHFSFMSYTWEFQYLNLLLTQQSRNQINKKIDYYKNYTGSKPLIFNIMLGITCHWTTFMAFKRNGKNQFWYFDSHNDNLLNLNKQQIIKYVQNYDIQRVSKGKNKLTNFERQKIIQSIIDSQISIKLIIQCLQGKGSIDQYTYNQLLNVFAKHIQEAVNVKSEQLVIHYIKQYWYNIFAFFRQPLKWELLTEQSKSKIKLLIQVSQQTRANSNQGRDLYDVLKKHKMPKGFFQNLRSLF